PPAPDPRRGRGEHPLERRGRRAGGGSRAARLGRRVGAPGARLAPDGAGARGDAEPVRRLHRSPHRPADREAPASRRRRGARHRGRARDPHLPRDQRAAGPARPARRPCPRREGGGAGARRLLRRALDSRAELRRARGGAGAAGLADEGRRRQHAHVEAARQVAEAALMDFREDGAAALEWAARYLERVSELPVLAQVAPGELSAQLPASAPEQPEPFSAVLRDLDDLLLPAFTNWQSPRFFSYFAVTSSEPAILAELLAAALNQVALVWRASPASTELELRVADWVRQLLGLPDGWHGHIEDTASKIGRASCRGGGEGSGV